MQAEFVLANRHQESRARVKQIRVETRLDRSRPMAMLDRRLIDRIVANLVNNAIKFSPAKSHVLVETAVRDVVANVLQEWIVETDPAPGTQLHVGVERGEVTVDVRAQ